MIDINEYLLSKASAKNPGLKPKAKEKPKAGCDVQDIMDWLDSFGLENFYEAHEWPEKMDIGGVGYKIYKDRYGNNSVSLESRPYEHMIQSIIAYPSVNKSYISWGYTTKDIQLKFDDAIRLMEEVMKEPEKMIKI